MKIVLPKGWKELAGVPLKEAQADLGELIDKFCDQNKLYHFESSTRNLMKVLSELQPEYRDITSFLSDNPGAQEAILEWVRNQRIKEWIDNMQAAVGESDESED